MRFSLLLLLCCPMLFAQGNLSPIQKKVRAAMDLEYRSEANRDRDRNRAPVRAVEFFGLKEDMKVIELLPGGGWYTELLGPVLKEKGELYVASKKEWLGRLDKSLKNPELSKVKKLPIDIYWDAKNRCINPDGADFGMTDADMVLSIREYHAFNDDGAKKVNDAIFKALKPGGTYIVIDHTRRHMEADSGENRRRRDPVKVIKEVLDAGFELDGFSSMFFRADDELRFEVGRRTVTGNTDRFFLRFKKPN